VNTRKGTTVTKRTIVCFDQHCFDFPITLYFFVQRLFLSVPTTLYKGAISFHNYILGLACSWGEDTQIVDGFKENETVLFFTSIRLRSFQGKYSGTFQQSSTVMSNPRTPAGHSICLRVSKFVPFFI
jgi:hypothetical protein